MRKLLPLLAALLLVVLLAGCGGSSTTEQAAAEPPAPADLATAAIAALEEAGSAHYVFEIEVRENGEDRSAVSVRAEGDASGDAVTARVNVDFEGIGLSGTVLANRDELFVDFMGQWYGERGLDLDERADELPSKADVQQYFDDLFTGAVEEGPEIDGVATWRFEGKLDADGFADLTEKFEDENVTAEQRALLRLVAEKTRFVLDVGQEDDLPRHVEFRLELSAEDLDALVDGLDVLGIGNQLEEVAVSLDLSDFGTHVAYDAPTDYRPLDELGDRLFNGLG
jgi:hypothetical protein